MSGYLIDTFGWESVFYFTGSLGLLWIICWKLLIYDTPAEHPTISNRERTYIETHISGVTGRQGVSKKVRKLTVVIINYACTKAALYKNQ